MEFLEGWGGGGGGSNQKTFRGGGMGIIWNNTLETTSLQSL